MKRLYTLKTYAKNLKSTGRIPQSTHTHTSKWAHIANGAKAAVKLKQMTRETNKTREELTHSEIQRVQTQIIPNEQTNR